MGISDWSSDVCSSDLCLAVGQLHDQGVFRIAGLSPGRWGQAGQQLTWQQQTGQQAENKKMPAVHTKLLTRKISPKSAPEDQPWAPCAFTTRSEEYTSELKSTMRISYAIFCLKKNNTTSSN